MDFSKLVPGRVGLSNDRTGGREKAVSIYRVKTQRTAGHLGVNMSRLPKLQGERTNVNAKVSLTETRSDGSKGWSAVR